MIITITGYGIELTEKFGRAKREFSTLVNLIHHYYQNQSKLEFYANSDEYNPDEDDDDMSLLQFSSWLFTCPSAEKDQIALGFEVKITKETDFKALEKRWNELLNNLPKEISDEVKRLKLVQADIVQMSGKC